MLFYVDYHYYHRPLTNEVHEVLPGSWKLLELRSLSPGYILTYPYLIPDVHSPGFLCFYSSFI